MTEAGRPGDARTIDFGDVQASTRRSMTGNRRRDTTVELAVRHVLHRRGLRYRVDYPIINAGRTVRADIAFTRRKIAVFLDGCFWHGCPEHGTLPKRNGEYWGAKISRNRTRDAEQVARVRAAGWTVMRFWEHESPEGVADSIARQIRGGDAA